MVHISKKSQRFIQATFCDNRW